MHTDNHSHIILANIESMVDAAEKTEVDKLAITEHISQFEFMRKEADFHSVHESGRMFSSFDEYLAEFRKIDGTQIRVNKGLEVDFIESEKSTIGREVGKKSWDILLCSVHELENGIDVELPGLPQDPKSSRSRWVEYFEIHKKAILSDFIRFDVLTHPVRLATSTPSVPEDFDELLLDLAQSSKSNGKALELNGNDIRRTPDLVRRVAEACRKSGCKVSYGSDSHYPKEVSRNFDRASELVRELDLTLV